ncbi:hypothetical protein HYV43_05470 [Candidatus Micrarchaeota archaeon]|nr:hypothetical protein [Candidatus Micrarchaeota archaeon]
MFWPKTGIRKVACTHRKQVLISDGHEDGHNEIKRIMASVFDALHEKIQQTVQAHNDATD